MDMWLLSLFSFSGSIGFVPNDVGGMSIMLEHMRGNSGNDTFLSVLVFLDYWKEERKTFVSEKILLSRSRVHFCVLCLLV